jgi:hypothetical protein
MINITEILDVLKAAPTIIVGGFAVGEALKKNMARKKKVK